MESMEKTLRTYPGVRDATVYINMGKNNGYVMDVNSVVNSSAEHIQIL